MDFSRLRVSKVRESIPYVGYIPKVIIPLNLVLDNSQVSEFPGRSSREAHPLKHILLMWTARGQHVDSTWTAPLNALTFTSRNACVTLFAEGLDTTSKNTLRGFFTLLKPYCRNGLSSLKESSVA